MMPPCYGLYMCYSRLARELVQPVTDLVEPFGLDEFWLDVTDSVALFGGDPMLMAREISERVRMELGITVPIGVYWNKVFAKFGSDHAEPDSLMLITPVSAHNHVYPAPVRDPLCAGPATERKLRRIGTRTVGQLASARPESLRMAPGKIGLLLRVFVNGAKDTPVTTYGPRIGDVGHAVGGVGGSTTMPSTWETRRPPGRWRDPSSSVRRQRGSAGGSSTAEWTS